jgi:hypothetical protein
VKPWCAKRCGWEEQILLVQQGYCQEQVAIHATSCHREASSEPALGCRLTMAGKTLTVKVFACGPSPAAIGRRGSDRPLVSVAELWKRREDDGRVGQCSYRWVGRCSCAMLQVCLDVGDSSPDGQRPMLPRGLTTAAVARLVGEMWCPES